jgi:hypothetical protein
MAIFNYSVDWLTKVKQNLPILLRLPKRIDWIIALIKPIKDLYADFLIIQRDNYYAIRFTSQILYLQKLLNDLFDPTGNGIYITDYGLIPRVFLYNKIENNTPFYLYNKWDSTVTYATGEFSIHGQTVWKAQASSTNVTPGTDPSKWRAYKDKPYLRNKSEYALSGGFVINIPSALVYNDEQLRAIVDSYKFAGRYYIIVFY